MTKKSRRIAKARRTLLTLSLVLVVAFVAVGGTIAWLTDTSDVVINTFTNSDVDIEISETGATYDSTKKEFTKSYKMVPGDTLSKDPKVTVKADSEACYVFVKIEESNWYYGTGDDKANYLTYVVDSGWTALSGYTGIYYKPVADTAADQEFKILANDQVTVDNDVTKTMMDALTEDNYPTLKFTSYAIQSANLTDQNNDSVVDQVDAWKLLGN